MVLKILSGTHLARNKSHLELADVVNLRNLVPRGELHKLRFAWFSSLVLARTLFRRKDSGDPWLISLGNLCGEVVVGWDTTEVASMDHGDVYYRVAREKTSKPDYATVADIQAWETRPTANHESYALCRSTRVV